VGGIKSSKHVTRIVILAKFRDLIYGMEFGPSIGCKFNRSFDRSPRGPRRAGGQVMGIMKPITESHFRLYIRSRNLAVE